MEVCYRARSYSLTTRDFRIVLALSALNLSILNEYNKVYLRYTRENRQMRWTQDARNFVLRSKSLSLSLSLSSFAYLFLSVVFDNFIPMLLLRPSIFPC